MRPAAMRIGPVAAYRVWRLLLVALLAWLDLAGGAVLAATTTWGTHGEGVQPIPPLTGRVVDLTQTLDASQKQALETKLADWESRTGNQLVVLLVPSTQPEPIEDYSIRVAEAWKIGRRGQDNGAIFLIAKNDKRMRIEVGYGLEGTLTDATSRRIIAENVAPLFSKGDFAGGVSAGVDRIMQVVGSGQPLADKPSPRPRSGVQGIDFGTWLLLLLVVVPLVGRILSGILGRLLGSVAGAGIVGIAAWLIAGSLVLAVVAGVIGFLVMIFSGFATGFGRSGGVFFPTTGGLGGGFGGGWGGGGGGGGFSGGGGSFGGGGASGGWN